MTQNNQTVMRIVAVAIIMAMNWQDNAFASGAIDERIARTEQLQRQLDLQRQEIKSKDRRISELEEWQGQNKEQESSEWFQSMTISGAVEIEAFSNDNNGFSEDDASDLNVSAAELGLEAVINDWATAKLVLLWEEEDGGGNELTVDEASISFANTHKTPFHFTAGRTVVPFGRFETNMISDPFTLELGETKESLVMIGLETAGFYASVYGFNGDLDDGADNVIDNGGLELGISWEGKDRSLDFGVSYINDIGDSDGISDVITSNLPAGVNYRRNIPGYAVHAIFSAGSFNVIGEYIATSQGFDVGNELAFNGNGAKPSAWNLEAGYAFDIAGHESIVSLGYQKTAELLGLGLPEKRIAAVFSVVIWEDTTFSLEWAHDEDYGIGDVDSVSGTIGTGDNSDTVTAQLAIKF